MRLFLTLLPWLELFTLIQLGIMTSALTALAYVFLTFLLGLALMRSQGREMFVHMRQQQEGRILGPQLLLDDMVLGLAGLLLMIPGLITDFAAVLVMIGPFRRRLLRAVSGPKPEVFRDVPGAKQGETIDGSYRRVDDDKTP
ncbi:MAG: FxsA family protein [Pseudomonadota bacterium]